MKSRRVHLDMTLLDPPETDAEGNVRSFSIASGPHEETLMVATRMRDTAVKHVLRTMPLGTAVKIEGPSGDLTLPDNFTRASVLGSRASRFSCDVGGYRQNPVHEYRASRWIAE